MEWTIQRVGYIARNEYIYIANGVGGLKYFLRRELQWSCIFMDQKNYIFTPERGMGFFEVVNFNFHSMPEPEFGNKARDPKLNQF